MRSQPHQTAELTTQSAPASLNQTELVAVFTVFLFVLHVCVVYIVGGKLLLDADTFWHVRVGHDIWQNRAFPTHDVYSFTFFGRPWIAKEWLSQVIYYWAYRVGGWNLVAVVPVTVISAAIALLYFFLCARLRPTLALAIAMVASFAASGTYLARPHILTFPLLIIWSEFLLRASEEDRAPSVWLLPIVSLWVNLHASFPLAIGIAGLCLLNFVERNRLTKPAQLYGWLSFLALSVLATLVNPYGYKVTVLTLRFMQANEAVPYINEWRPLVFAHLPPQEFLVIAMLAFLLYFGLRLRLAKILMCMIMLHFFLQHVRFAYLFYYLVPLFVSFEMAAQHPKISAPAWLNDQGDPVTRFLQHRARLLVAGLLTAWMLVTLSFLRLADLQQAGKIAPRAALEYARSANLTRGHVLNYYNFGGFLIFNGVKTFVDGRADQIFNGGFMDKIDATGKPGGGALLAEQLKHYAITWTLLSPNDPRVIELDRMPGWKRAYADEFAVIHVPEN